MKKLITADDITAIVSVTDPQYAPDGTRAAYVKSQVNQEKDSYTSNIWIYETKTGGSVPWTHGEKRSTDQDGLRTGARLPLFLIERAMRHSCI